MNSIEKSSATNSEREVGRRELKEFLSQFPFLRGLSERYQEVLADCAMVQTFAAGERMFREGDPANRFYLVVEGNVALESANGDEEPIPIQKIGARDVLGWSWLFPPYYWHFSARATEPTKTIFLYGTRLLQLCEEDPALGYELMKRVSAVVIQRLQATRKELLLTHRR